MRREEARSQKIRQLMSEQRVQPGAAFKGIGRAQQQPRCNGVGMRSSLHKVAGSGCAGFLRNASGAPVHCAVYAALVDAAIGCALATVNPESAGGVGQTTLDLNVSYLAAARGPTIFAEGTLLRRGRTVAFGEVRVTDEAGNLLAVVRATYLILSSRS